MLRALRPVTDIPTAMHHLVWRAARTPARLAHDLCTPRQAFFLHQHVLHWHDCLLGSKNGRWHACQHTAHAHTWPQKIPSTSSSALRFVMNKEVRPRSSQARPLAQKQQESTLAHPTLTAPTTCTAPTAPLATTAPFACLPSSPSRRPQLRRSSTASSTRHQRRGQR